MMTMSKTFSKIGLIGKTNNPEVKSTLVSLVNFLQDHGALLFMEPVNADEHDFSHVTKIAKNEFGHHCDVVIVVGGDGSFLDVARALVDAQIPLIGVNRGRRGFLTDISPQALTQSLEPILAGHFQEENRFLIEMELLRHNRPIGHAIALNDVVLHSGDIAKMIDFQVFIHQQFVYRQRSDGVIAATPTGSTAYALSAGGPIISPSLEAMVLVPMHPSILTSRPIVVASDDEIEFHLMPENTLNPRLSCDGQIHFDIKPDDRIRIRRKQQTLKLLHPLDYDYFHTLRTKLSWSA